MWRAVSKYGFEQNLPQSFFFHKFPHAAAPPWNTRNYQVKTKGIQMLKRNGLLISYLKQSSLEKLGLYLPFLRNSWSNTLKSVLACLIWERIDYDGIRVRHEREESLREKCSLLSFIFLSVNEKMKCVEWVWVFYTRT